jgi:ribosomal-protein-serine acetyltransferase
VGSVTLHLVNRADLKASIGYWLEEAHQGSGLTTMACGAVLEYAFGELGLNRVEIWCAVDNARSRAVPERLGFTHEGTTRQSQRLHDRHIDEAVYGMLASEWNEGKSG